jgi:hypothetical protein
VSYSGGMFAFELLLNALRSALAARGREYALVAPRLPPVLGAALYAAKLSDAPLTGAALAQLEKAARRPGT